MELGHQGRSQVRVAVIGTAGRGLDGEKLSLDHLMRMYAQTLEHVAAEDDVVSGGAPYGDHVAVMLWLAGKCRSLTLYLPAEFGNLPPYGLRFQGHPDAKVINRYHLLFSQRCGIDSFSHIDWARQAGARLVVVPGFKNRNMPVGDVDRLVAHTFATGAVPKDGGTRHTWNHSRATTKIHLPIR